MGTCYSRYQTARSDDGSSDVDESKDPQYDGQEQGLFRRLGAALTTTHVNPLSELNAEREDKDSNSPPSGPSRTLAGYPLLTGDGVLPRLLTPRRLSRKMSGANSRGSNASSRHSQQSITETPDSPLSSQQVAPPSVQRASIDTDSLPGGELRPVVPEVPSLSDWHEASQDGHLLKSLLKPNIGGNNFIVTDTSLDEGMSDSPKSTRSSPSLLDSGKDRSSASSNHSKGKTVVEQDASLLASLRSAGTDVDIGPPTPRGGAESSLRHPDSDPATSGSDNSDGAQNVPDLASSILSASLRRQDADAKAAAATSPKASPTSSPPNSPRRDTGNNTSSPTTKPQGRQGARTVLNPLDKPLLSPIHAPQKGAASTAKRSTDVDSTASVRKAQLDSKGTGNVKPSVPRSLSSRSSPSNLVSKPEPGVPRSPSKDSTTSGRASTGNNISSRSATSNVVGRLSSNQTGRNSASSNVMAKAPANSTARKESSLRSGPSTAPRATARSSSMPHNIVSKDSSKQTPYNSVTKEAAAARSTPYNVVHSASHASPSGSSAKKVASGGGASPIQSPPAARSSPSGGNLPRSLSQSATSNTMNGSPARKPPTPKAPVPARKAPEPAAKPAATSSPVSRTPAPKSAASPSVSRSGSVSRPATSPPAPHTPVQRVDSSGSNIAQSRAAKSPATPLPAVLPGVGSRQWMLVRLDQSVRCDACTGTALQETIDGSKAVFQCEQVLHPRQLSAAIVDRLQREGAVPSMKTWVFCADPLCMGSRPRGSSLPPWPVPLPIHHGTKLQMSEMEDLHDIGLEISTN